MATASTKPMSAEEFFAWANRPENQDRFWELEQGEVIPVPPPCEVHGVLCGLIAHLLWRYVFQRGQGYVATNDTGLLVEEGPDTVRGPDVMLFGEAADLDQLSPKYTRRVPRLIVEVVSPNDQRTRVTKRVGQYLQRGVALVWIVDPEVRSVTVCRADRFPAVLDESDEITGEDVLPEMRHRVGEFFALPRPRA